MSVRRALLLSAVGTVASGAMISQSHAQSAETSTEKLEVVVVTGSFIRGAAEEAALPVQVISADDLEKRGAPSMLETIKSISAMNGIVGEANQFGAGQAQEGSTSINLRGLGAARTLVLLNGRRLPSDDANRLPASAIGRVEVLKDGAAATYGSDAIGGVVNFITRENFQGLDLAADYRYIPDSDGDYTASVTWGTSTDRMNVLLSGNYFHRSPLLVSDRDWAVRPLLENAEGGWSSGVNPSQWRTSTAPTAPTTVDPDCQFFGGEVINSGGTKCMLQYTPWDNLVEEQDTYQLFGQLNFDLTESMQLNVEALYASTDVPHAHTTPSFTSSRAISAAAQPAGAASAFNFIVPSTNPGFAQMVARGVIPATATNVYMPVGQYRPFFAGGNPAYGYGESFLQREREQTRFVAELSGEIGGINWTAGATYGESHTQRNDLDMLTDRVQLALRGLGGEGCNRLTGTPGVGPCTYLNPFSNAIPRNPFTRAANPNFASNLENSAALVEWMTEETIAKADTEQLTADIVVNGELGFALGGGNIGWALGSQYRDTKTSTSYNDIANQLVTPCSDTPLTGNTTCTVPTSPYMYLATYKPTETSRDMYALFGEVSLPVTDNFNAQIAGRFEDYGNLGGSTFNPKLSLRWQVIDMLALRGSVGTTFRAPPVNSLIPDSTTTLQNFLGINRPVETTGNPDLEPEEALTFSVGLIFTAGNFRGIIDFWSFDLEKVLTTEPRQAVVDKVFPNGATGANNCGVDPAFEASHFEFANGVCSAANITKLKLLSINGSGIKNDGIDVSASYTFDNVAGGSVTLGSSGTWIHKYEVEALVLNGQSYQSGYDGVGFLNDGLGGTAALPEWRAEGYFDFNRGDHNLRWTTYFIDQYTDQRNIFATNPRGRLIESWVTHDLTYRVVLPQETTLVATVTNVFDEDPPFVRKELNYDPQTGNPIGRSFKIGVRKQF